MSELSQFILPRGFRFAAGKAGLKASGRPDFALIVADAPASAAAAFTANRVIAAPLIIDKQHLSATGGRCARGGHQRGQRQLCRRSGRT